MCLDLCTVQVQESSFFGTQLVFLLYAPPSNPNPQSTILQFLKPGGKCKIQGFKVVKSNPWQYWPCRDFSALSVMRGPHLTYLSVFVHFALTLRSMYLSVSLLCPYMDILVSLSVSLCLLVPPVLLSVEISDDISILKCPCTG